MKNQNVFGFVLAALPLVFGALCVQCAGLKADGTAAETRAWVSDWRQNIFQDTEMPPDGTMSVNLAAAKNDVEPFQINIRSAQKGKITGVTFSDLVSGGNTIPAGNFTYNFVGFVRSRNNSRYVIVF